MSLSVNTYTASLTIEGTIPSCHSFEIKNTGLVNGTYTEIDGVKTLAPDEIFAATAPQGKKFAAFDFDSSATVFKISAVI